MGEWGTESAETMYSAEVTDEAIGRCPPPGTFTSFGQKATAGSEEWAANAVPPPRPDLIYLDSLLMTLMRAPFSSFSL